MFISYLNKLKFNKIFYTKLTSVNSGLVKFLKWLIYNYGR